MVQRLLLLAAVGTACTLSTTESAVEVGMVHIIAFDRDGRPASGADVVVHDADGQLAGRAVLGTDGTGDVRTVAGATVSVAIRGAKRASVVVENGEITSFASVPIGATLHVGVPDEAVGTPIAVAMDLPADAPAAPAYEVELGCGPSSFQHGRVFVLEVPAGCAARPRTVMVRAFTPGFSTAATSVLRGVDLTQAGGIHMPAFQPVVGVSLDVASHDPHATLLDGWIRLIDRDARYEFFGDENRQTGHIVPRVATGPWDFTEYHVQVRFDRAADTSWGFIDRIDPGAPAPSTSIDEGDFLVPPHRGAANDPLAYVFDGNPDSDYRLIDLRYGCLKCTAQARWRLFGPPGVEPLTFPEMPDDLKGLTPRSTFIEISEGLVFDASELDGYEAWLATDPARTSAGTHRSSFALLAEGPDD